VPLFLFAEKIFTRGATKISPFNSYWFDRDRPERGLMFLIIAVVLVVLWLGGLLVFKTAGLLIHLLLLFAVISLIMHFISRRRAM
jgi:amino acid permease